ncbi:Gti1/Pac2 family-domain-containing protein [Aspergillus novoparasiticus]|uniref:Gti1/Pac2 family-domain-containing protein n=1 Tax=Aspergillus novoparasiticus TaxID=986946 RepID=A0A5N6E936_9EURO|nr:Gti1/Pac2 family-domain-containing protein [Aspergillus novoparasiticus]
MNQEVNKVVSNEADRSILPGQMETYYGNILSTKDAVILFEACRTGYLPSVQRRLSEKEQSQIRPGSVFVWTKQVAGMQRWTDSRSWSASRASGRLFTYYEIKRDRVGPSCSLYPPVSSKDASEPQHNEAGEAECTPADGQYKVGGLVKRTLSVLTTTGKSVHLVWYLSSSQDEVTILRRPSTDPTLRFLQPKKELYTAIPSLEHDEFLTTVSGKGRLADLIFRSNAVPATLIRPYSTPATWWPSMQVRRRIASPQPPIDLPKSSYPDTTVSQPYDHRSPAFCSLESDITVSHGMTGQSRGLSYPISQSPSQPPLEHIYVHGGKASRFVVADNTSLFDVVSKLEATESPESYGPELLFPPNNQFGILHPGIGTTLQPKPQVMLPFRADEDTQALRRLNHTLRL